MTLTKVLRDTGLADRATVHGFRSSFRDWASERTSVPHAVCEMALAHRVGSDVERSYARSDLFEKRLGLMDLWGAFVTDASAKVVRLHG
jgi:integrase